MRIENLFKRRGRRPALGLNKLLLLSSVLFAPAALAQEPQSAEPPPVESEVFGEEEIVVLGRNIPEPMRQTSEVATFLSQEELQRSGDDTAATALTRLTGLSLVSNRFVFVRGLGDRYSSALLNGSPLPSPEPLRRTVPLDLFPSNILNGASVQKTFSANYPGEFGGGIIDLRTLRIPNETFLTAKVGFGVNTETTNQDGLVYEGGERDWTGFDSGIRDQPAAIADAFSSAVRINNLTGAEKEVLGESLVNSPLTVIQGDEIYPHGNFELSGGRSFDVGSFNIGLVGVAGYDNTWSTRIAERGGVFESINTTTGDRTPETLREGTTTTTNWDITLNALGTATLGWGEQQISSTVFYVHTATKEAQIGTGRSFSTGPVDLFTEATGWYERELMTLQFDGEHRIGDLELSWRTAGARSKRDAPYEREVRRVVDATGPIYTLGSASTNSTRFSELEDEIISGGVDAEYTFSLSDQRDAVLSAGYAYSNTTRIYESRSLSFQPSGNPLPDDVARARVDFLFSPDNIDPNRFFLFDSTGPEDAYTAGLLVNAAYAAADVEILPLIRASVGARYEEARQGVRTFNRYGDPTVNSAPIENEYVLPAATITWNFAEDLQLRLGYSQTIARPQFRELAPTSFLDPETDRVYVGNRGLVDSELENYDVRLEYYFGRNQFVTVGSFFKRIENPIEEALFLASGGETRTTFINAPQAEILGAEIEYRTRFESPWDIALLNDKEWLFSINYTYTGSEIIADGVILDPFSQNPLPAAGFGIDGAQLQGTPENIVNMQFGYETENSQLTLLVGWVDERILQRGFNPPGSTLAVPDLIDDPGVNVDLVYRREFQVGDNPFTLSLSGRNLLDEQHVEYQTTAGFGRTDVNTYDRGQSFSISLSTEF